MASKFPGDDPMTGIATGFKTRLTYEDVVNNYAKWARPKRSEFIQKLIEKSGLSLAEPSNPEMENSYLELKDVLFRRWDKFHNLWKKARCNWLSAKLDKNRTFLDLAVDFQILIKYDAMPLFGGSQASTNMSNRSWVEEEVPVSTMRKDFVDMVPAYQRQLTEDILDSIEDAAEKLGLSVEDLLLYLCIRKTHNTSRKRKAFENIKDGSFMEKHEFPIEKAVGLKNTLKLSTREWVELRLPMQKYVRLPPKDEIRLYEQKMSPSYHPYHFGIQFKLQDVVTMTLERLPKHVFEKLPVISGLKDNSVKATWNGGFDASSSQHVYNSATSLAQGVDSSHFIMAGASFISLSDSQGNLLYSVPSSASPFNVRPVIICPGKEERPLAAEIHKEFQKGMDYLEQNPPIISFENGSTVKFKIDFRMNMMDNKVGST